MVRRPQDKTVVQLAAELARLQAAAAENKLTQARGRRRTCRCQCRGSALPPACAVHGMSLARL